ncbi:cation-transporting P-type ATPase [Inquilinus limosus]|uniref:cation-translocating P-type ATPase n=1 Tax=Inquilinus limosus TaxID=171674 RepID=UPI003F13F99E
MQPDDVAAADPDGGPAPSAAEIWPVHVVVPGRARFRVDGLRRSGRIKQVLERRLNGGIIQRASASTTTGTLLVLFDPTMPLASVEAKIRTALRRALAGDTAEGPPDGEDEDGERWHGLSIEETLARLDATPDGLSQAEARRRLARHGPNAIPHAHGRSRLEILLGQVQSLPVALLAAGSVLSLFTGAVLDAAVILAVVGMNAGIGYLTETQADRTIGALSEIGSRGTRAVRDGVVRDVAVEDIAPGDVLDLWPGTVIAADARLVAADRLTVNEAALTGESLPVLKRPDAVPPDAVLADRIDMVYRGTVVTGGAGRAVAVATGPHTQMGRIQALVDSAAAPETPMQLQLDRLGRQLAWASLALCGAVLAVGLLRGYRLLPMLKSAVSLAVAAVPEGLPTLATTTLALGLEDLRRRGILVRQLATVEGLSAVQIACFDKTGTLTQNRMSVARIACGPRRRYRVVRDRTILADHRRGRPVDLDAAPDLARLLQLGALCSEADILAGPKGPEIAGSGTEAALVRAALAAGLDVAALRRQWPRTDLSQRSDHRPYMVTTHVSAGRVLTAIKGSPDDVLAVCRRQLRGGVPHPLTENGRRLIRRRNAEMASEALRVLGLAYRLDGTAAEAEAAMRSGDGLVWVGLAGLADPLRDGAADAIAALRQAGVAVLMITGDQAATANAIARTLALAPPDPGAPRDAEAALREIRASSSAASVPRIFARVTPGQKLRIVRALQQAGLVVAMTGDGVNDTPPMKAADIGVALGGGADAALQTADVVLHGDELIGLSIAIERGRATYANIRRAIRYLLATNLSEIALMLAVTAAGIGGPLSPMQLLWLNLVSDVLPALGLALEPPDPELMRHPPRDPAEPIIPPFDMRGLVRDGALIAGGGLAAQIYATLRHGASPRAQAVTLAGLVTGQLLYALTCRAPRPAPEVGIQPPGNPYLPLGLGLSFAAQAAALFLPGLRRLFGGPIDGLDLAVALGTGALPLLAGRTNPWLAGPGKRGPTDLDQSPKERGGGSLGQDLQERTPEEIDQVFREGPEGIG